VPVGRSEGRVPPTMRHCTGATIGWPSASSSCRTIGTPRARSRIETVSGAAATASKRTAGHAPTMREVQHSEGTISRTSVGHTRAVPVVRRVDGPVAGRCTGKALESLQATEAVPSDYLRHAGAGCQACDAWVGVETWAATTAWRARSGRSCGSKLGHGIYVTQTSDPPGCGTSRSTSAAGASSATSSTARARIAMRGTRTGS
jgi:hypothetical protein